MEEQFRTALLSDSGVSSVVGSRISWGARAQGGATPALVLHLISDGEQHTQTGRDGLSVARVQVDCHGSTYAQATMASRAVRAALDGYRGGIFQGVFLVSRRNGREGGSNEADRPFLLQLDFIINWSN